MQLELDEKEVGFIVQVLNQLPTSSGAFPLVQKIMAQATTEKTAEE